MSGLHGSPPSNDISITLLDTPPSRSAAYLTAPPPGWARSASGGMMLSGWQDVSIVRSCERVPSAFAITATERYPGQFGDVWITPGQACRVHAGSDLLITGYADSVTRSISADQHVVHVTGRSLIEDIVDCSITSRVLTGLTVTSASLIDLANKVCTPYGISVAPIGTSATWFGATNLQTLTFTAELGESGFEVLEHAARYAGVMLYDNEQGDLVISSVGTQTMASGFAEGVNVQAATGTLDISQRFSVYQPSLVSYQFFSVQGAGNFPLSPIYDKTMPRLREKFVISEQFQLGQSLAEQRAQWEMARRYGRSQGVRITCDSWRDSAGTLWAPNAFASIYLPSIKCAPTEKWIIADVIFRRDIQTGTTAELLMYPKEAFAVQPEFLLAYAWGMSSGQPGAADIPKPGANTGGIL